MLDVESSTADWKRGRHSAVLNSPLFSVENQRKPQQVPQVSGRELRKYIPFRAMTEANCLIQLK